MFCSCSSLYIHVYGNKQYVHLYTCAVHHTHIHAHIHKQMSACHCGLTPSDTTTAIAAVVPGHLRGPPCQRYTQRSGGGWGDCLVLPAFHAKVRPPPTTCQRSTPGIAQGIIPPAFSQRWGEIEDFNASASRQVIEATQNQSYELKMPTSPKWHIGMCMYEDTCTRE